MSQRLLVQLQLSNYTPAGIWILECDSGFQMCFGRIREMLRLNPTLQVDVIGPRRNRLKTQPEDIVPSVFASARVRWLEIDIVANAAVTRYDFNFKQISDVLRLQSSDQRYDVMYLNDPMLLRHYRALFFLDGKYLPKFFVHSHFVDVEEAPKFPREISLWLGQCEAALKADYNFWQCESAMLQFFDSMGKWFTQDVVDDVRAKSMPWDDGFSASEINVPVDMSNVRFTQEEWDAKTQGKTVIFFPNRISPSSGDYTNGMKFMFELLPKLRERRQDFVVVCGNPNQKFSNAELEEKCGKDGYIKLTEDTFNRDEYKFVAARSDIALGLYNADAYGGTAARECIELGCMPLWLDNYEYSSLAREALAGDLVLAKTDFSDLGDKLFALLDLQAGKGIAQPAVFDNVLSDLQEVIRNRCSYEATTPPAMKRMGLLDD